MSKAEIVATICALILAMQNASAFDLGALKDAVKQIKATSELPKDASSNSAPKPSSKGDSVTPAKSDQSNATTPASPAQNDQPSGECLGTPIQALEGDAGRPSFDQNNKWTNPYFRVAIGNNSGTKFSLCLNSENLKYSSPENLKNLNIGKVEVTKLNQEIAKYPSCRGDIRLLNEEEGKAFNISSSDRKTIGVWRIECSSGKTPPYEKLNITGHKDFRFRGYDPITHLLVSVVSPTDVSDIDMNSEFVKAVVEKYGKDYKKTMQKDGTVGILQWKKENGLTIGMGPGKFIEKPHNELLLEIGNDAYKLLTYKRMSERYAEERDRQTNEQKKQGLQYKPNL